jgi:AraC-like DNA-binding protein
MHSRSSGSDTSPKTDPLAAVIDLLRPQAIFSKVISGRGKWSVRYAPHDDPAFCVVLGGGCFLEAEGAGRLELAEGDFIFFPATPGFTMASDLSLKPKEVQPTYDEELRHGSKDGEPTLRMLGGYFRFDRANAQLLLRFLPAVILIRGDEPGAARLRRVVELIAEETREKLSGRELVLERLVEILLVEALRFRPAASEQREQGLLSGLADPALAKAIRYMHEEVARSWTVAELAKAAGMSRAVFAERFMRKVGMPPMQYLLEWRMAIAKDILRRERAPLAEVAEMIGYQSASAFSTAFSRSAGVSPSAFARG